MTKEYRIFIKLCDSILAKEPKTEKELVNHLWIQAFKDTAIEMSNEVDK